MTMKLINKLRSITHTLSMGILFKPNQDPTVCPKHGPMAGCTGRANPDIDPDNEWDTIYYCPECLHEEQEAHLLDSTPWLPTLQRHIASTEPKAAIIMTERSGEERTDILYLPEVDGGAKGWYHTTEDEDTEGPYRTRDEALIKLGEYRERVRVLDLIRYN